MKNISIASEASRLDTIVPAILNRFSFYFLPASSQHVGNVLCPESWSEWRRGRSWPSGVSHGDWSLPGVRSPSRSSGSALQHSSSGDTGMPHNTNHLTGIDTLTEGGANTKWLSATVWLEAFKYLKQYHCTGWAIIKWYYHTLLNMTDRQTDRHNLL